MKMFALRGKKKEMELPGDFFVDSMCVALPQGWSGRGAAATAQPGAGGLSWRGWGAATAGTGNQEEHKGAPGSCSTQGSRIRPCFLPWGNGTVPGDVGLQHSPVVPAHTGAASAPSSSTRETLEEFPLV